MYIRMPVLCCRGFLGVGFLAAVFFSSYQYPPFTIVSRLISFSLQYSQQ
jgi:hypothetical protein